MSPWYPHFAETVTSCHSAQFQGQGDGSDWPISVRQGPTRALCSSEGRPSLYKLSNRCPRLQVKGRHSGWASRHRGNTLIRTRYLCNMKIRTRHVQCCLYKSSNFETYNLWEVLLKFTYLGIRRIDSWNKIKQGHGDCSTDQKPCSTTAQLYTFGQINPVCFLLLLVYLPMKLENWPFLALEFFRSIRKRY